MSFSENEKLTYPDSLFSQVNKVHLKSRLILIINLRFSKSSLQGQLSGQVDFLLTVSRLGEINYQEMSAS